MVWIREWLWKNNIPDSEIGFDGTYVTISGKKFYKPEKIENDLSYGNVDELTKALSNFNTTSSNTNNSSTGGSTSTSGIGNTTNPTSSSNSSATVSSSSNATYNPNDVRIRDYALNYGQKYGLSDSDINWVPDSSDPSKGRVTIGGVPVTGTITPDAQGRTWGGANDVQTWVDRWARVNGRLNDDSYNSQYKDQINALVNDIINTEKFKYDPYSDPSFLAYKEMYEREGNRSFEDTMGLMASMTGGLPSSWAASSAASARQQWSDRLMNAVPNLEALAYNKYRSDIEQKSKNISYLQDLDAIDYNSYWKNKNYKERYL